MHRFRSLGLCLLGMLIHVGGLATNLAGVVQDALKHDPSYLNQISEYNRVAQDIAVARADLQPSLGVFGQTGHVRQRTAPEGHGKTFEYGIHIDQKLLDFAAWGKLKQAHVAYQQAAYAKALATQKTLYQGAMLYFQVLTALSAHDAASAHLKALKSQFEQVKHRYEAGVVAKPDLYAARAQYWATKANMRQVDRQLQHALHTLSEMTGTRYQRVAALGKTMPMRHPIPKQLSAWEALALDHNLSVLVANKAVAVADQAIDVGRAARLPTVAMQASRTRARPWVSGLEGPIAEVDQVLLKMTWALYAGGKINASVKQLQLLANMARHARVQAKRAALTAVRDGYTDVVVAIDQVKASKQALIASRSARLAMQEGYNVGVRTITDVLQSLSDVYHARLQYAKARYQYLQAILALKASVGALHLQDVKAMAKVLSVSRSLP